MRNIRKNDEYKAMLQEIENHKRRIGDFETKSDIVDNFFKQYSAFIRIIKAPWEALKDIYRSLRQTSISA